MLIVTLGNSRKRVRVSAQPPDVDPVCPKSGPPKSWFDETGEYTEGCNACKALELGLSRMGKSHSSRCCQRYVDWLKAERTRFHGRDTRDVPGDEEIMPYKGHDHEVIPYVEVPPEEHEDVGEEYTPSIPASPKGVLRDSEVDLSKEPSGPVPKGFEDLPGFSRRGSVFDGARMLICLMRHQRRRLRRLEGLRGRLRKTQKSCWMLQIQRRRHGV